jgi:hypothetical protein
MTYECHTPEDEKSPLPPFSKGGFKKSPFIKGGFRGILVFMVKLTGQESTALP